MRRMWLGLMVAGLLVLLLALAAGAQQGGLAGLLQPLVVDVEQAVPVEVALAVPVGEGEVMTASAPPCMDGANEIQ